MKKIFLTISILLLFTALSSLAHADLVFPSSYTIERTSVSAEISFMLNEGLVESTVDLGLFSATGADTEYKTRTEMDKAIQDTYCSDEFSAAVESEELTIKLGYQTEITLSPGDFSVDRVLIGYDASFKEQLWGSANRQFFVHCNPSL